MKRLVIATRRSPLALWQASHVKGLLEARHRGLEVELLPMTTRGDQLIDQRLDQAGGKGLFVKELEIAMAEGRADLAVHSMKDLPADLPAGFVIAAITQREDPRDAFVSLKFTSLSSLPDASSVGTSSLRRSAQIAERFPKLESRLLRGNVETRIAKLDRGEYDGIVLAVAGLVRLGLESRIRSRLEIDESLPAPGQGALGIECLESNKEVFQLLVPLADPGTALCVHAERAVSRALGGSCTLPLAAYAESEKDGLLLRALVAAPDGRKVVRAQRRGREPRALGEAVAADLRRQGADEILKALP